MSTLVDPFSDLTLDEIVAIIERSDDPEDLDGMIALIERALEWEPLPHQIAPDGDWTVWWMIGGRGTGKTDGDARWMDKHAQGPPCDPRLPGGHRMSIVAPTLGDAAESCVNGPSGLKAHNPQVRLVSTIGGTVARWPNGAEAKLFGGYVPRDVERFRAGGNRCACWIEEAAAVPQLEGVLEQIPFGHRLGKNPQVVLSTTPKPRAAIKRALDLAHKWLEQGRPMTTKRWDRIVVTRGTTDDNPYLDAEVREGLYDLYGGSRLAAQELQGQLLDDFDGALWNRDAVDRLMVAPAELPNLVRRWVGIDPSMWGIKALEGGPPPEAGEIGRGVETGIVVSGVASNRHVYTVADYSKRMTPNDWANRAIDAAIKWKAGIVPETNAGGPLVVVNIKAAEAARRAAGHTFEPIRIYKEPGSTRYGVHASDGKRARAEPIAALTDQGRHHFVEVGLELLIDQCCGWDPNESWSPDRMDALVWSVHALAPWKAARGRSSTAVGRTLSAAGPGAGLLGRR